MCISLAHTDSDFFLKYYLSTLDSCKDTVDINPENTCI